MLGEKNANATIAVSDIERAKKFYEGVLGLTLAEQSGPEVLLYRTGGTRLMVYRSQYAGTNKATAATWTFGKDVDAIVETLKARGVVFEKYDFPGSTREGDVHVTGHVRVAWFKDPEGNILSIVSDAEGS